MKKYYEIECDNKSIIKELMNLRIKVENLESKIKKIEVCEKEDKEDDTSIEICKKEFDATKDHIFLLSIEEYEKYKNKIPNANYEWWLRSPDNYPRHGAIVGPGGSVCDVGLYVHCTNVAVRPVINFSRFEHDYPKVGERIIKYNFPWIVIGEGLAIAEVPIVFRKFDEKSNDYENSEMRRFLLDWLKERIR